MSCSIAKNAESVSSGNVMSENRCNGKAMESDCENCNKLEKEMVDDWNDDIGSLTDDNITAGATNDQHKDVTTNGPLKQTNSINQEVARDGKKTHPKLHHHLSWQNALKKAKSLPDPWEKFHIDDSCPTEVAIRHRYNALKKNWVQDEVRVKMESLVSCSLSCYTCTFLHLLHTGLVMKRVSTICTVTSEDIC